MEMKTNIYIVIMMKEIWKKYMKMITLFLHMNLKMEI